MSPINSEIVLFSLPVGVCRRVMFLYNNSVDNYQAGVGGRVWQKKNPGASPRRGFAHAA
jgi:hypothetical protein